MRLKELCAAAFLCAVAIPARASFVPSFQGTTPVSGGLTQYTYNLIFTTAVDPGSNTPVERLQAGDFVTLYDIFGLQSATAPSSFSFSIQNTGMTAPSTAPDDDASLANVTFVYQGETVTTDTTFNLALIVSTSSNVGVDSFTGRTTRNSGANAGSGIGNVGTVSVPIAPSNDTSAVPEPATFSVAASGAFAILLLRRKKRS